MNIYAKSGHKVIFKHPNYGYENDQETARKHLKVGGKYTVENTSVDTWKTDVYLKEVPGIAFNSVLFEDA